MRLYRTWAGTWAGTQADATRLGREDGSAGRWKQIEVPTDKVGLLEWLNANVHGGVIATTADAEPASAPPPSTVEPRNEPVERQIAVEEEIQSCDLPRLAVLAQNVAWRFQELARQGGVQ